MDDLTGKMLQEFIKTFEASLDPRLWITLVKEETDELLEALETGNREHILKEATDLMYTQIGFNLVSVGAEQLGLFSDTEHAEVMTQLSKSAAVYDKAVDFLGRSTNFFEAFRRVHLSNMSKLDSDGLPIKNHEGKVLKGPNYTEPKLTDLV